MPFCQNCGKVLAEGEVCTCQSNPAPNGAPTPNTPPPQMGQPVFNNVAVQQQPQKKSLWWIWLIIIPIILVVLMVGGILAAILVPSMLGYTNKSKLSSMNSSASSIYKAANSALTEMDEERYKINGYYIISSDERKNYNVPDSFDTDVFYEKMNNFFSDNKKNEWFVVVDGSYASYSANSDSWDNKKFVGTYPAATMDGPTYYDSSIYSSTRTKADMKELYKDAKSKVENKSSYESSYSYTYY